MPHEYEVDIESGSNGKVQTVRVHIPDHQHHEKLQDAALFFSIVATLLTLPREVIKTARYIRTLR